jgi:hypothetical protein
MRLVIVHLCAGVRVAKLVKRCADALHVSTLRLNPSVKIRQTCLQKKGMLIQDIRN